MYFQLVVNKIVLFACFCHFNKPIKLDQLFCMRWYDLYLSCYQKLYTKIDNPLLQPFKQRAFLLLLLYSYHLNRSMSAFFSFFYPKSPNFVQLSLNFTVSCMPHNRTIITNRICFALINTLFFLRKIFVNGYHHFTQYIFLLLK